MPGEPPNFGDEYLAGLPAGPYRTVMDLVNGSWEYFRESPPPKAVLFHNHLFDIYSELMQFPSSHECLTDRRKQVNALILSESIAQTAFDWSRLPSSIPAGQEDGICCQIMHTVVSLATDVLIESMPPGSLCYRDN